VGAWENPFFLTFNVFASNLFKILNSMKATSLKILAAMIGAETDSESLANGVAVDTRILKPEDLFFALPGENCDGHDFVGEAASKGCVGAVVSKKYKGESFGLPLLFVEDVLKALQNLAKLMLSQRKVTVVAVTGSLGKTTTKGFIAALLKHKFRVSVSPGNSNSQIGLPLTILNHTTAEDEVVVLEMGMSHPGQLSKLIEIAPPDIAVITTVALVHAENFTGLEEIARSKAEIFGHPSTRLGIYPADYDHGQALAETGVCPKLSFSITRSESDFCMEAKEDSLHIWENGRVSKPLPHLLVPGVHNRHNFLAAVAVARNLGMDWEAIKAAQTSLELPERRLQTVKKNGVIFINDAYNASEMSMKAALSSLPQPENGGNTIAFLGGIVELGKFSEACHREVGKFALDYVDRMFCFGEDCLPIVEEWRHAGRLVVWTKKKEELMTELLQQLRPGDVVLLKGSQAKEVWKVLESI
jgi:UDP-N-acetylmuramoyl-tripeptide--D-alanyl-D-alanine ligase